MSENPATRKARRSLLSAVLAWIAPVCVLLMLLISWEFFVWYQRIPEVILPSPRRIAAAGVRIRTELLRGTLLTAGAAGTGLLFSTLLGSLTAFLFALSPIVRRAFYPYAVLLQTVPIIAIAPIIIVSLGRGFTSISLIACIISLFPIITNTTTGLTLIDQNLLDLFRLHRASWWQVLIKLRLPCSLPYLFTGIRIASGTAIVGAIVGEFFVGSGQPGLGALIQRKTVSMALDELYAAVIASTLLGTAVFALISLAAEGVLRRYFGMGLSGVR